MARNNDPKDNDAAWKLYQQLVERAWSDPAFKELLRKDPKGTIQAEINAAGLDISLPNEIQLIEHTEKVAYFTLPTKGGVIC
jgi:hypothetical protein